MPRRISGFAAQETAIEWLARVSRDAPDPQARTLAAFALDQWAQLSASWKRRGVKTRRSLWDLVAGVFECCQNITHHAHMTPVVSDGATFYFPIFEEAVGRRSKHPSAAFGAIRTGILPRSSRLPQTGKWGNVVCKT